MAVNVKMGVDLGGFTAGIKQGQNVLKGLNAEMKATEAEFKATGNAEQLLASKTKTLNSQIQIQKGIADQAKQALKAMDEQGIEPTNASYQKLYATMMNATAGMNNAQAELNALGTSAQDAAAGADKLTSSVQGISKKISLDQVISGINTITNGLERAAQKAIQLGEELWNTIMDSARRADDTATMADMYGIPLERFMQMQRLASSEMETSVDAMLGAQDKLNKGVGKGTEATIQALKDLGIEYRTLAGDEGVGAYVNKDSVELFWEAGQALFNMSDAYDKEAAAQALFGKSWRELSSLFENYKSLEEYNKALDEMTVNDEETVRDLAALNDAVTALEDSWTVLKDEVLGTLAPELTKGAEAISGLLDNLTKYLKTEDGQKLLEDLGTAVSGLFDDLGKIDPEQVVSGFTGIITSVTDGIKWLVENAETVKGILGTIVGAWALSNVAVAGLEITKLIQGLTGLAGAGAAEGAAAAGAAAGASWGGAFAAAVLAAAPWLLSVIAAKAIPEENKLGNEKRVEAAEYSPDELSRLRQWVDLQNELAQINAGFASTGEYDVERFNQVVDAINALGEVQKGDLWSRYWDYLAANNIMPGIDQMPTDFLDKMFSELPEVPVTLAPETSAAEIAQEVGPVTIPATVKIVGFDSNMGLTPGGTPSGGGGGGPIMYVRGYANGLSYVPYDGMLARLHKGERVMTAREVQSRNYSSNLYVESMIMNNNTDAEGLAAAMAAAQRRTMNGYGS